DVERGRRNLANLAQRLGLDALAQLVSPLGRFLPRCPAPDMALNNLERFFSHPAAPGLLPALLDSHKRTLEVLLQLFATSQTSSALLAQAPDCLEMLRVPLRRSPGPDELRDQLQGEVDAAGEDSSVLRAFRRFRQRHMLRIGANDIIRDRPLEEV